MADHTETIASVHALVKGRVQGVFFRASTRDRARELGVAGWVRNLKTGEVELRAEGAPGAVDELVQWCHDGPPAARVENVERREIEAEGFDGFDVRPTASGPIADG